MEMKTVHAEWFDNIEEYVRAWNKADPVGDGLPEEGIYFWWYDPQMDGDGRIYPDVLRVSEGAIHDQVYVSDCLGWVDAKEFHRMFPNSLVSPIGPFPDTPSDPPPPPTPKDEKVAMQVPTVGGLTPDEHEFAYGDASKPEPVTIEVGSSAIIEVGSLWRDEDGDVAVVKSCSSCNVEAVFAGLASGVRYSVEDFCGGFSHIVTPAKDLSNVEDGQKLVGFDGEVVTKHSNDTCRWTNDERNISHSVNGLPSFVIFCGDRRAEWHLRDVCHREEGASVEYGHGGRVFHLHGEELTPEEWGARTPLRHTPEKIEPEYRQYVKVEAKVGMEVDVEGSMKPHSGRIEEVGADFVKVQTRNGSLYSLNFVDGEWQFCAGTNGERTITHQGCPVVLPDHIPDDGKKVEEPDGGQWELMPAEIQNAAIANDIGLDYYHLAIGGDKANEYELRAGTKYDPAKTLVATVRVREDLDVGRDFPATDVDVESFLCDACEAFNADVEARWERARQAARDAKDKPAASEEPEYPLSFPVVCNLPHDSLIAVKNPDYEGEIEIRIANDGYDVTAWEEGECGKLWKVAPWLANAKYRIVETGETGEPAASEEIEDLGDKRLHREKPNEDAMRAIAYLTIEGWEVRMLEWDGIGYGETIADAAEDALDTKTIIDRPIVSNEAQEKLFAKRSGGVDGRFEAFWLDPKEWEEPEPEYPHGLYIGAKAVATFEYRPNSPWNVVVQDCDAETATLQHYIDDSGEPVECIDEAAYDAHLGIWKYEGEAAFIRIVETGETGETEAKEGGEDE